ncbi:DUF4148 domain-containing protein [Duganella aceris]|uniref:DUF4148 domain-containing protein n=1 Tax=Duganella aceris TaxID=2703883 RepID=A0ABX0FEW8_9BURK|nr:DUF4148 domain-containing protein [Duganella aceris]NGZ83078.1 DUF4148 domain-containing protein [Duganella aceris]
MNAKSIIASVPFLLAAGAAFAAPSDENEASFDQAFRTQAAATSSVTREQVIAETLAARKAGLLDTNEAYTDIAYLAPRPKSANVKAQMAAKPAKDNSAH